MKKKILMCVLAILFILCGKPALSQSNLALAGDKPEIHFANKLYFIEMGKDITITWDHVWNNDSYDLRAFHVEGDKYYNITDTDGLLSNKEAKFTCPRTGHLLIELRSCNLDSGVCSEWTKALDTNIVDEPIGWYLFARPAAVTGGGID